MAKVERKEGDAGEQLNQRGAGEDLGTCREGATEAQDRQKLSWRPGVGTVWGGENGVRARKRRECPADPTRWRAGKKGVASAARSCGQEPQGAHAPLPPCSPAPQGWSGGGADSRLSFRRERGGAVQGWRTWRRFPTWGFPATLQHPLQLLLRPRPPCPPPQSRHVAPGRCHRLPDRGLVRR